MGKMINSYKVLECNSERKRVLDRTRHRCRWTGNIKINIVCDDVDWISLIRTVTSWKGGGTFGFSKRRTVSYYLSPLPITSLLNVWALIINHQVLMQFTVFQLGYKLYSNPTGIYIAPSYTINACTASCHLLGCLLWLLESRHQAIHIRLYISTTLISYTYHT
jgi:hypothetical protein